MPDTTVPYQAYRSKRHSSSFLTSPPASASSSHDLSRQPLATASHSDQDSPSLTSSQPTETGTLVAPSSYYQVKPSPVSISTKKASTFRRIPRRDIRPSLPSSPLGPKHSSPTHSRNVSMSSIVQGAMRTPPPIVEPQSSVTSPTIDAAGPPPPPIAAEGSFDGRHSLAVPSASVPQAAPQPTKSISNTPNTGASTTSSNGSKSSVQHTQAPYRPGFQPRGVYRPLTDEFLALRNIKRDGEEVDGRSVGMKRVERTKLTRRLEKLIDLHFPHSTGEISPVGSFSRGKQRPRLGVIHASSSHRRASSLFDFDIKNVNISDAGGLWRGLVGSSEIHNIRVAEQRITPWQDDADVTKCPLCFTFFHPLTNRKHHCRLCGQIICSLPVKRPHRPVLCSLLFIVDPKTRRIEEVNEGVDYGVRKKAAANSDTTNMGKGVSTDEDRFLKGVRVCRTCRPILLRQQYQRDVIHVPTFSRLYEALVELEKEIEESLPHFQELILSLSHNDQPTKEVVAARRRLVEAFSEYDSLSKKIRKLPCSSGAGGSQDRVQIAIMTRANLFLQKNMFPLQSLPVAPKNKWQDSKTSPPSNDTSQHIDPDSRIALALQPLLEQEALLETFVEEANAHRKFEDAKTLKANLREIRAEIERIVTNGENGLV